MHRFKVWAPGRRRVELVADGRRLVMTPADRDWWEVSDEAALAGTRYGFSLDGGDVRPDPRSASQPDGVLGRSEVIDHSAYAWSDAGWKGMPLAGAVLYELHTGTFTPQGTFGRIVERLPHLIALGIDAIELIAAPSMQYTTIGPVRTATCTCGPPAKRRGRTRTVSV